MSFQTRSKPHRTDIISFGPKFSVAELILQICVLIEYHQRTFPFQVAHEICHTDFRRDGHQHVDMIRHQMPFQNLNPFIFAEALQNFFYTFTELCEDYFPSIFWSKDDMILAQPFRMR